VGADRRRNVLRYELALRNEARRLLTDGGFRPDGTFVAWPAQHTARSTEAFCRAVLRLFVRLELFDADQAAGMLAWPHSGFHVHTAVWVPEDDRAFATDSRVRCLEPLYLKDLDNGATLGGAHYIRQELDPSTDAKTILPEPFLKYKGFVCELVVCTQRVRSTVDLAIADRGLYPSRQTGICSRSTRSCRGDQRGGDQLIVIGIIHEGSS